MLTSPSKLTYRFHEFRPSDRQSLRAALAQEGGEAVFVASLEIYLKKWAIADYITVYEIERIAVWVGAHFRGSLLRKIEQMAARERALAQTENAKQTYSTMLDAVRKELGEPKRFEAGGIVAVPR